tara:strand:+ start:224 stop:451 length:228 start_codon:yes stop_codon:yes gene_type:complete
MALLVKVDQEVVQMDQTQLVHQIQVELLTLAEVAVELILVVHHLVQFQVVAVVQVSLLLKNLRLVLLQIQAVFGI